MPQGVSRGRDGSRSRGRGMDLELNRDGGVGRKLAYGVGLEVMG